ncbi:MAG TPA: LLM class flavin-dependent oxidoreductase [Thermomicrobiales bacterium]|nr:LLM class flavin-dependent oxidoreductase [Thermomicrobiales bacterium]
MPDPRPRPQFGYCLPIFANPSAGLFRTPNLERVHAPETLALGRYAEEIGFDSLWVADHLMLGRDEAVLEGWTILSALAGSTSRARIGMIHQAHYFRSPSLAAKMIGTLDQVAEGRLILFYDFGRQQREHLAYHLPYPDDVDVRVRETIDGLKLILDLWSANSPLSTTRGPYGVTNAVANHGPVQQPHPPIWFGEVEEGLLDACAEFGQGWNTTPCGIDELNRRFGLLRNDCDRAGRDYDEIEKSVELQVLLTTEEGSRAKLRDLLAKAPDQDAIDPELLAYANGESAAPPASFTDMTLIGSPAEVEVQLRAYVDAGADHFLLWFLDAPERTGMDLFAREVAPAFA